MIKIGDKFFDENNTRYLVVNGTGCDPQCYSCEEIDLNDNGDFETSGLVLLKAGELKRFRRVE